MRKDFEWLNDASQKFLNGGYLNGQSAQERLREITDHAEHILDLEGFSDKMYSYLAKGWISLASPVWSNFGNDRGLPVSCFSLTVGDSVPEILYAVSEVGEMSKLGGGTGGYVGNIRPRGSEIKDNGKTSGAVHFLELFSKTTEVISQGSTRRGRFSPYLPIDHGDIEEFLRIGYEEHPIQNMTHAVTVTDEWMESMIAGDSAKRAIWAKVLQARRDNGYPYIMFKDNANNVKAAMYKNLDMDIQHSNLCVAPETLVLTKEGYKEISTLKDQKVEVWNGEDWSEVTVRQTGTNQRLIKVVVKEGDTTKELHCTPYHKFFIESLDDGQVFQTEAQDLLGGDLILPWNMPNGPKVYQRVLSVIDEGRVNDTFCFTEPKRHMGVFNGILTGQCSEILLPTNEDESLVCVLSSLNLLYYDEWKDTDLIETMVFFLDSVVTDMLMKLEKLGQSSIEEDQLAFHFMERAYNFARRHRALGLGVLGWHSFLQSKMIPFESEEALVYTEEIFDLIQSESYTASKALSEMYGEPEYCEGYGRRNTTLNAIAPTTSSAFILGQVSQSIEPYLSNCYVKDLANIKYTVKNPHLEKLLEEKGKNTVQVWESISKNDGSVEHLDFLSDHEKAVFRSFRDIAPMAILQQAAVRQMFLDQTQSLNIMIDTRFTPKEVNQLVIEAWKMGIPTLYYQRNTNAAQDFARLKRLSCESCEA